MSAGIEIDDDSERWSARSTSVTSIAGQTDSYHSKRFSLKIHTPLYIINKEIDAVTFKKTMQNAGKKRNVSRISTYTKEIEKTH